MSLRSVPDHTARPRALSVVAWVLLLVPCVPCAHAASGLRLDLCAGGFFPFDSEHREAYGAGVHAAIGASVPIGSPRTLAFADVGRIGSSGSDLVPDPTFRMDDASYWVVPVTLGIRLDLNSEPQHDLRFFLGLGWQTTLTHWSGPQGDSDVVPSYGAVVELRPEYRLGATWSVWLAQRFVMNADVSYDSLTPDLNYSGNLFSVGLGFGPGTTPHSPSRTTP